MNVSPMRIEIHEHGIYERRNGMIVGPAEVWGNLGHFSIVAGEEALIYDAKNGGALIGGALLIGGENPFDLVREIVVGEGWQPWNGATGAPCVNVDQVVEIVFRHGGHKICRPEETIWQNLKFCRNLDILAYRVVDQASTGSTAEPVVTQSACRPIPTALERLTGLVACLARECAAEALTKGTPARLHAIANHADALLSELRAPPARENGA